MNKHIIIIAVLLMLSMTKAAAQTTKKTTLKLQGVEMVETLSDDGTKMIKRPYRWFAGIGKADDEGTAVEMAMLEAFATVSRVIENGVLTEAKRSTTVVNGKVQQALNSHWEQVSMSIQKACEPFGDTEVTYNSETGMYEAIVKVGIRGDRFVKLLDGAKNVKPEGLDVEELKQFANANKAIIDAAKGN